MLHFYNFIESVGRAFRMLVLLFAIRTIVTMLEYADSCLIFFTFIAVLAFILISYIIYRRVVPTDSASFKKLYPTFSENRVVVTAIRCLKYISFFVILLAWGCLNFVLLRAFDGNEHLISTTYTMERNAFMLIKSLPNSIYARASYVACTMDSNFSLKMYNTYYMVDVILYCSCLIYGVCSTLLHRANLYCIYKRRLNSENN